MSLIRLFLHIVYSFCHYAGVFFVFLIISFFFLKFIYFERDRDSTNGGGTEREGETRRLHTASAELAAGLEPTNHEIMT